MLEQFIQYLMTEGNELYFASVSIAIASIPTIIYLRASGEEITAFGFWGAIWNWVLK